MATYYWPPAAINWTEETEQMTDKKTLPSIYEENTAFWDKAWNMVKAPYTQLPDLPYVSAIPEKLKEAPSGLILDLGCGSGWLSVYLARQGFKVIGVDIASHACRLGQMWAGQESLDIEFQVKDISALDYPDHNFSAVVANSIMEHLTYDLAAKTLSGLKRILVPGGMFYGCFDQVGTGPGEYFKLEDGTQVYTDKGRKGMILRCFSDQELEQLFGDWQIESLNKIESGTRILIAKT